MLNFRFLLILAMCQVTLFSFGQNEELLEVFPPRKESMSSMDVHSVQLDPKGKRVFYLKRSFPKAIFFRWFHMPNQEHQIDTKNEVVDYKAHGFDGFVLVSKSESGTKSLLNYYNSEFEILLEGMSTESDYKIIRLSDKLPNKVMVHVSGEPEIQNNGYRIADLLGGRMRRVSLFVGYENIVFDDFFQVVAGVKTQFSGKKQCYINFAKQGLISFGNPIDGGIVSSDGKNLYFTDSKGDNFKNLYMLSLNDTTNVSIIKSLTYADIYFDKVFVKDNGQPMFFSNEYGKISTLAINKDIEELIETISNAIGTNEFEILSISTNQKKVLIKSYTLPLGGYYIYEPEKKSAFVIWPEMIKNAGKNVSTALSFTTRDRLVLPVGLHFGAEYDQNADGIPDMPLPTVFYLTDFQETPFKSATLMHLNRLVTLGYLVLTPQHRASLGLGKQIREAGQGDLHYKVTLDIVDAIRWAVVDQLSKEDQVAVMGSGYGGFLANSVFSSSPNSASACISINSYADVISLSKDYPTLGLGNSIDKLKRYDPLTNSMDLTNPTLLFASDYVGTRNYLTSTELYANDLANKEKEVIYLTFLGQETQGFSIKNWVGTWALIEQYLAYQHNIKDLPKIGHDLDGVNYDIKYGFEWLDIWEESE